MKYKAILFDLGNTLAIYKGNQSDDLYQGHLAFINQLSTLIKIDNIDKWGAHFHHYIANRFADRLETFVETPISEIIFEYVKENFNQELPDNAINELIKVYFSTTEPNWNPANNLREVLQEIKNNNVKMGILSNACSNQNVQNIVDDLEIRSFFDFVISSCYLRARKPGISAFVQSINNWDFDTNEILMVGDTMSQDIIGANALGMPSAWISYGRDEIDPDFSPTIVIKQLSDLISHL